MTGVTNKPGKAVIYSWFKQMEDCVRRMDYAGARPIFSRDVLGYGTFGSILRGIEALQKEQWENVWPKIRDFTFRLEELDWDSEENLAWGACPWDSLGVRPDGATFQRLGRVTVVLRRQAGGEWVAIHTHFSLNPQQ